MTAKTASRWTFVLGLVCLMGCAGRGRGSGGTLSRVISVSSTQWETGRPEHAPELSQAMVEALRRGGQTEAFLAARSDGQASSDATEPIHDASNAVRRDADERWTLRIASLGGSTMLRLEVAALPSGLPRASLLRTLDNAGSGDLLRAALELTEQARPASMPSSRRGLRVALVVGASLVALAGGAWIVARARRDHVFDYSVRPP